MTIELDDRLYRRLLDTTDELKDRVWGLDHPDRDVEDELITLSSLLNQAQFLVDDLQGDLYAKEQTIDGQHPD